MADNNSLSSHSLNASTTHTDASPSGSNPLSHAAAATSAIFMPIAATVLQSVDPISVAVLLKKRVRYEFEIETKATEMPLLRPVVLTASFDCHFLKSLFYLGDLEPFAPGTTAKTIINEQLGAYIPSLVTRSRKDYNPAVIKAALETLKFPVEIEDATAQITCYCKKFFELLEAVEYNNFRADNPKPAINLLLQRVQPNALHTKIFQRVEYDSTLEKSVPKLIVRLKAEAISCQEYDEQKRGKQSDPKRDGGHKSPTGRGKQPEKRAGKTPDHERPPEKDAESRPSKPTSKFPLCLWEKHASQGIQHYMNDCTECPKAKKGLLDAHHARRRENSRKVANRIAADVRPGQESIVLFSADFGGVVCGTLCADSGADANLMNTALLARITNAKCKVTVTDLTLLRKFYLAAEAFDGSKLSLVCKQVAIMAVEVHIRRRTADGW